MRRELAACFSILQAADQQMDHSDGDSRRHFNQALTAQPRIACKSLEPSMPGEKRTMGQIIEILISLLSLVILVVGVTRGRFGTARTAGAIAVLSLMVFGLHWIAVQSHEPPYWVWVLLWQLIGLVTVLCLYFGSVWINRREALSANEAPPNLPSNPSTSSSPSHRDTSGLAD